jgi:hypothetical protein
MHSNNRNGQVVFLFLAAYLLVGEICLAQVLNIEDPSTPLDLLRKNVFLRLLSESGGAL